MDIWQSLGGQIMLRITSADIPSVLSALADTGVDIHNVHYENDLEVLLTIPRKHTIKAENKLRAKNCDYSIEGRAGKYWVILGLKNRYILLTFLVLLIFLSFWIPSKALFIEVRGNNIVPSARILEVAMDNGLQFASSRKSIPINDLKSSLLSGIPELNWVGITSSGCVVQIHVSEKAPQTPKKNDEYDLSHIVSNADGIVEKVTVLSGTALCKPGQAISRGQLLISGYQDLGLCIRIGRAEGEIIAQTFHKISVITPRYYSYKTSIGIDETKFSLIIGKKQINLYKGSGISPPGCVKMYSKEYVSLPGGFFLPVALVRESTLQYQNENLAVDDSELDFVYTVPSEYVLNHMISGSIIQETAGEEHTDDCYIYSADLICREQIGKTVFEE